MLVRRTFAAVMSVSAVLAGLSVAGAEDKPKIADRAYVKMVTSKGDIFLELNAQKAPVTVENFLRYVDEGFYNGTIFHRVINNFMIQGGGFDKDLNERKARAAIRNEWQNGLKNKRGTIAMARTNMPDSATAQFFINVVDNSRLDQPISGGAGYAVFGRVIKGMETVDLIKAVKTGIDLHGKQVSLNPGEAPVEPVVIERVVRVDPAELKNEIAAAAAADAAAEKQAMEARTRQLEEGRNFVKARGADVAKGVQNPSGLWWVDVTPGTGPAPAPTDRVKVHYTGWLPSGTKFDSSLDRGQPTTFGLNQVIKGWTEGVGSMKVGGKRFLVIPPELGYGAAGAGNTIPPNAVLVFEVELLEIVK